MEKNLSLTQLFATNAISRQIFSSQLSMKHF